MGAHVRDNDVRRAWALQCEGADEKVRRVSGISFGLRMWGHNFGTRSRLGRWRQGLGVTMVGTTWVAEEGIEGTERPAVGEWWILVDPIRGEPA